MYLSVTTCRATYVVVYLTRYWLVARSVAYALVSLQGCASRNSCVSYEMMNGGRSMLGWELYRRIVAEHQKELGRCNG